MRILIANHEYPPLEGGAANAAFHLAREVAARGHRVWVVTLNLFGGPPVSRERGVTVIRLPFKRRRQGAFGYAELLSYWVRARVAMTRLGRRLRPDLIHAFFAFPDGLAAGRAATRLGIPCVISLRGSDVPGFREGLLPAMAYALLKPVLRAQWRRSGVRVVANSSGLAWLAGRTARDVEIPVIPNGVDCERFRPAEQFDERPAPFVLLSVAQLVARKRLEDLIGLLPWIRATTGRDVRLRIIGRGPMKEALEKAARAQGVGDFVTLAGHVPPADMPAEYRSAHLFVLLSKREGMANAMLEAMASGLPMVVTGVEGVQGLVTNGREGLVVSQENVGQAAAAITGLVTDAARRRDMGAQARRSAQSLSWVRIAEAYLSVYREVSAGGAA